MDNISIHLYTQFQRRDGTSVFETECGTSHRWSSMTIWLLQMRYRIEGQWRKALPNRDELCWVPRRTIPGSRTHRDSRTPFRFRTRDGGRHSWTPLAMVRMRRIENGSYYINIASSTTSISDLTLMVLPFHTVSIVETCNNSKIVCICTWFRIKMSSCK